MSGLGFFPHVQHGSHSSHKLSARSGLIEFALRFDKAKIDSELAVLAGTPSAAKQALRRALNRSVEGLRTDVAKHIRTEAPLRARDVREGLAVFRARNSGVHWEAGVHVRGGGVPLIKYDVRPMRQTAMKGRLPKRYKHLTYLLERSGTRHGYKGEDGDRSLFAATVHGKLGVYYRQGADRDRINQVWGPTLQFHVAPEPVREMLLRGGGVRFDKELAHQIKHLGEGGK